MTGRVLAPEMPDAPEMPATPEAPFRPPQPSAAPFRPPQPSAAPSPHRRAWRRGLAVTFGASFAAPTWRAIGYLIGGFPLACVGFGFVGAAAFFGGLLAVTFVGLPILAVGGMGAVWLGGGQRRWAMEMLGRPVEQASRRPSLPGLLGWLQSRLVDPAAWRAAVYWLVHLPIVAFGLFAAAFVFLQGVVGVLYPLFSSLSTPTPGANGREISGPPIGFGLFGGAASPSVPVHHPYTLHYGAVLFDTWPRVLGVFAAGILLLVATPWLLRALALADVTLVRFLLGAGARSVRIARLEAARGVVADDAAATLRRIERDLHDGTQAQLVALAMNLGEMKDRLAQPGARPEGDRALVELVERTHTQAKEALVELRGIAGGIHPPALDLGLDHALATLVARSVVPASLDVSLAETPSDAVATIAYYSVAELLTNVAKHSGAAEATITVRELGGLLVLTVSDDGHGGADPNRGTGLAGLSARLGAIDGSLHLASPAGGPTAVTVELPLRV